MEGFCKFCGVLFQKNTCSNPKCITNICHYCGKVMGKYDEKKWVGGRDVHKKCYDKGWKNCQRDKKGGDDNG